MLIDEATQIGMDGVRYPVGDPRLLVAPPDTGWVDQAELDAAIGEVTAAGVVDATGVIKGKVKLAGDLGGTADLPTVPGLTGKATPAQIEAAIAALEAELPGTYVAAATTGNTATTNATPWLKSTGGAASAPPRVLIASDWQPFAAVPPYAKAPRVLEITDRGDISQQGAHLISGSMSRNFPVTMLECSSDLDANDVVAGLVANFPSQHLIAGGTASGVYFGVDALGTIKWAGGTPFPSGANVAPTFDTALSREAAGSLLLDGQLRIKAAATAGTLLTVDAKAAQATDLMLVRDSVGDIFFKVHPTTGAGMLIGTVGQAGGTRIASAMLSVTPVSTNNPGIIVKRVAGQTAKLLQILSDADVQLAGFNSSGQLTLGTTAMDAGATLNIQNADGTGTLFNFSGNTNYIRGVSTQVDTNVGFKKAAVTTPQAVSAAATDAASTQTLANSLRTALIAYGLAV